MESGRVMMESPASAIVKSARSAGRGCWAGSVWVAAAATTAAATDRKRRRMLEAIHEGRLQRARRLLVAELQIVRLVEDLVGAVVVVLRVVARVRRVEDIRGELGRPAAPE